MQNINLDGLPEFKNVMNVYKDFAEKNSRHEHIKMKPSQIIEWVEITELLIAEVERLIAIEDKFKEE